MPKPNSTETISISLPSNLIDSLDYICGQLDINRSAAIKKSIKKWIACQLAQKPEFWERVYYGIQNRSKQGSIF